jgi:hypothetical protein
MLKAILALLAGVALLAPAPLVAAQSARLPAIREAQRARFELALTSGGEVLGVARGEFEGHSRLHYVYRQLPIAGQPERTVEVVVFDGRVYTREDQSGWASGAEDVGAIGLPSVAALEELDEPVADLGSVAIAGVPTQHYQIWLAGLTSESRQTIDLFVGQGDSYIHQIQTTIYVQSPEDGPLSSGLVLRFYDHDAPGIAVGPPPEG